MMTDIAAGARGAAGLATLLLLPGLLVVRAPWTVVPFLSLFFWIASWWWLPSGGRERLLVAALVVFSLAALLRLVRLDSSRPSWPALVALAAALLRVGAGLVPAVAAGARGARLDPTSARLMVWHDGLPATYVPLREAGDFGADAHGFDALAADVSLLSGVSVPLAVALAAAAARGLSSLALYALLARLFAPGPAALGALGAGLVVSVLEIATGAGDPASSLALAFLLAAAALLARGGARAPSFAAGVFVAAALMTEPVVAGVGIAAGLGVAAVGGRRLREEYPEMRRTRCVWAASATLVTAAPYLLRAGMALARG